MQLMIRMLTWKIGSHLLAKRMVGFTPQDVRDTLLFTGGLACGRGKGPSDHSVCADRTPLSFSYLIESMDVVVHYLTTTLGGLIFGVFYLLVK
jgi:hypothetical protein